MKLFLGAVIGAVGGGILSVNVFGYYALIPGIVIGATIGFFKSELVIGILNRFG